ncbi:hypothetical protein [Shimazuella soli]|uniref:hypothetical protein n=1 Tax=Shimazuella soli TaxID=1892854 RepID=UPI001F0D5127|nr:hypothetical protein [Shimazuella soli]
MPSTSTEQLIRISQACCLRDSRPGLSPQWSDESGTAEPEETPSSELCAVGPRDPAAHPFIHKKSTPFRSGFQSFKLIHLQPNA